MKTSEPLFDKILENNQLIKGRLNLKKYDLEKLYKALRKKNSRLKKKLDHQEELIRSNITKRNEINSQPHNLSHTWRIQNSKMEQRWVDLG